MIQLAAIEGGLAAVKGLAGLFKKRGAPKNDLENAVAVVEDVIGDVKKSGKEDPEALKILQDHNLEMEREYTKQAQAALAVMNTEAGSEDAFVRRSRPTLMYIGYIIMLSQLIVFPAFKIKLTDFIDREIIYWFYWMFSSGYLGYGVLRSMDKKGVFPLFGAGGLSGGKK